MPDDQRPRRGEAADQSLLQRSADVPRHLGTRPQYKDRHFQPQSFPHDDILRDLLGNAHRLPLCSMSKRTKGRYPCRTATCLPCRLERGHDVAQDVLFALRWAAKNEFCAHFLTINSTSVGNPKMDDIHHQWSRFCRNLRRSCPRLIWTAHRWTVGLCSTGRLHLHAITIGGSALVVKRGPAVVPVPELPTHAKRVGLQVWVTPVTHSKSSHVRLANYFADNGVRFALAHLKSARYLHAFPRPSGEWPRRSR